MAPDDRILCTSLPVVFRGSAMTRLDWHPGLVTADLWGHGRKRPSILFNATSAAVGGSATVLRNYWQCFSQQRPDWRFVILHGRLPDELRTAPSPNCRMLDCGPQIGKLWRRYLWERRWLGRLCQQLGCDVYFAPNGVYQPGVTVPQCLLVQDPSPFILPARTAIDFVRAVLLKRSWRAGVRHAACMGYTSEFMRSLVAGSAGGRREHRHLIAYNGIDETLRTRAGQPSRPLDQREPFVLSVSSFTIHKDFETLIAALAQLRRRPQFAHYRLRILGRNLHSEHYLDFLRGEIVRWNLQAAVSLETDRAWPDVSAAYESAALFCLTSRCESFGIPAIEAMAHGTPVVAGDRCAVPEICGDAAVLVPPGDPTGVAEAWARVLDYPRLYEGLQSAGQRRCLAFSWDQTVARWIEVIEELLSRRAGRQVAPSAT
jgi:glycosyltransferase involved in cell wall biosynthesis